MAKTKTAFVCTQCGTQHVKWQGRCNGCGQWNTLAEEVVQVAERPKGRGIGSDQRSRPVRLHEIAEGAELRLPLPDGELMRVLDGGIVQGSLILIGGEPGIGKSTLLLQLAMSLASTQVLYVTGEESAQQVKLRAQRLPGSSEQLYILSETALETILVHAEQLQPQLLIIDSIQTLFLDALDSAPGSIAQVRECTARLMRYAKNEQVSIILVGHINKEGMIAGPKVLEHMVDVVLEFEGERQAGYRILRSSKNRFGATPELGIYEMRMEGLRQVPNPSEIFLQHAGTDLSGVAIAATMQAQRPLLIETQALVSEAAYGTPQRSATGFDLRRMSMLLAVLEKKCGIKVGAKDIFVNLAGGIRLEDPALDLALLAACVSSLYDIPIGNKTAFAAEVGLTGEVRAVMRVEQRIAEAAKLGFDRIYVSAQGGSITVPRGQQIAVQRVHKLDEVFREMLG